MSVGPLVKPIVVYKGNLSVSSTFVCSMLGRRPMQFKIQIKL